MRYGCLAGVLLLLASGEMLSAQKKPGTSQPVPLSVTVHQEVLPDPDGVGPGGATLCGICGDQGAESVYEDGVDGVKAVIDQYGNLILDLPSSPGRRLFAKTDGVTLTAGTNEYMATITLSGDGQFTHLQGMSVDQAQSVRSCLTYDVDATQRRHVHAFQRDCYVRESAGSSTSFLVVTRLNDSGGKKAWTITTTPGHLATVFDVPMRGRIQEQPPFPLVSLPLRLTLIEK